MTLAEFLEQFGIIIRRDGTLQADDWWKAHDPNEPIDDVILKLSRETNKDYSEGIENE